MTQEEHKYFENFLDLFSMEGWKQLMSELEVRASSYSVHSIDNEQNLFKAKGELSVLANILNFENYIRQALDDDENSTTNQPTEG